jgi:hypothetical protein
MVKLRGPDSDAFKFFCNHFLQNVIGKIEWRTNKAVKKITDVATPSDEAFALLLLENSEDRWRDMHVKRNLKTSDVPAKYTNAGNKTKKGHSCKFKGWNNNGIKRFNQLLDVVIANRNSNSLWEDAFVQERGSTYLEAIAPRRRRMEDAVEERVIPKNDLSFLLMQVRKQQAHKVSVMEEEGFDEESSTEEGDEQQNDDVSLVHNDNDDYDDYNNQ